MRAGRARLWDAETRLMEITVPQARRPIAVAMETVGTVVGTTGESELTN